MISIVYLLFSAIALNSTSEILKLFDIQKYNQIHKWERDVVIQYDNFFFTFEKYDRYRHGTCERRDQGVTKR